MKPTIIFRSAKLSDAPTIVDFQLKMAWETEQLKLDLNTCTLGVRVVFENSSLGHYYVCELDSVVIGSLLITTEWSDWRNGAVWWIQSLYIHPEFRGQKYFTKFYAYIKNLAQQDPSVRGLRLYVDKSNEAAQGIYSRVGMNGNHYHLFEWLKSTT